MKPQTLDRLTTAAMLAVLLALYGVAGAIDAGEFDTNKAEAPVLRAPIAIIFVAEAAK